jgi:hypothetical protein
VLCRSRTGLYRVGSAVDLCEREVLNHRIEDGLYFHHSGVAEGWLVADGLKPVPAEYSNWRTTEVCLTFTDQFGHSYPAHAQAFLDRSARFVDSPARVRESSGPFETADAENTIWVPETTSRTHRRESEGVATPSNQ